MRDEGVVKFKAIHRECDPPLDSEITDLNRCRQELFSEGLIGVYSDGIGYGNVSVRVGDSFIISASATGGKATLQKEDYVWVRSVDPKSNTIWSEGISQASSESMTHAVLYRLDAVNVVLHVHSKILFEWLLAGNYPHTDSSIPYGTPEMAEAVSILANSFSQLPQIFAMAGHDEGVVVCGADFESAKNLLFETYGKAVKND